MSFHSKPNGGRLRTRVLSALVATACAVTGTASAATPTRHVLLVSVDGLHAVDLARFVDTHPGSALATLAKNGITYTQALAPAPADSFPGLLALVAGGTPAVTGVYYDVSWDRDYAPPAGPCKADGARVAYDEGIDGNGSHGIDPAKLPRDPKHGCDPVWPWRYLRTNTVFDVIHARGGYTAWADKHPAYAILEGKHGNAVDDLYTPEIGTNGTDGGSSVDLITASIARTEAYDANKILAVVNQIGGYRHDGRTRASVPTLFGLNLQTINVAQKLAGYADADGTPTPALAGALEHVDGLVGKLVDAIAAHGLADSTLIVVTAKSGNGPITHEPVRHIDEAALRQTIASAAPGEPMQMTADHGALAWLKHGSSTGKAARALESRRAELGIRRVVWGARLRLWFPSAERDSRAPDLVIIPDDDVIYAKPRATKLAEHGGFLDDDRHVALLLSGPMLMHRGEWVRTPVSTTSVAPTILAAFGIDPDQLDAVREAGTAILPRFTSAHAGPRP